MEITAEILEKAWGMRQQFKTVREIAKSLGVSREALRDAMVNDYRGRGWTCFDNDDIED